MTGFRGDQEGQVFHNLRKQEILNFFGADSSLLPGHKLEWPIFTTAYPVPGHERVN